MHKRGHTVSGLFLVLLFRADFWLALVVPFSVLLFLSFAAVLLTMHDATRRDSNRNSTVNDERPDRQTDRHASVTAANFKIHTIPLELKLRFGTGGEEWFLSIPEDRELN